MPKRYPELNGRLQRLHTQEPTIYLIDRGQKRHVPNPATYDNLFRDWSDKRIDENANLSDVETGDPIDIGAVLARGRGEQTVYLIDHGMKRGVTSPQKMDQYYFSWDRVEEVPSILLASIPTGDSI